MNDKWTSTWSIGWHWFGVRNMKLYTTTGRYYEFIVIGVLGFAFAVHFGGPARKEQSNE